MKRAAVVLREDVRDRIVAILVLRLGGEVTLTAQEIMGLDDDVVVEVSRNWPGGEDTIRIVKPATTTALVKAR